MLAGSVQVTPHGSRGVPPPCAWCKKQQRGQWLLVMLSPIGSRGVRIWVSRAVMQGFRKPPGWAAGVCTTWTLVI